MEPPQEAPKTCAHCGALIPPIARMSLIFPWMPIGLISILMGDIPKPKCHRCGREIDMLSVTSFFLPAQRLAYLVIGGDSNKAVTKAVTEGLRQHYGKDLRF